MHTMTGAVDLSPLPLRDLRKLGARKRAARLRAYTIAPLVDLGCIGIAVAVAALVRFDLPDMDMLTSLTGFLVAIYLSVALWMGGYDLAAFANRRRFVGRGARSILVTFLAIVLAFFSFKIGAQFSRLLIFILALIAPPAITAGRYFAWPRLNRMLGSQAFAELVIVDHIDAPPLSGAIVVSAQAAGLRPDMSTIESVDKLSRLAADIDRILVYCPIERREAWADILRCVAVRCELRIPELDAIRPLSVYTQDGLTNAIVSEHPLEWHQAATKRAFDIAVTLLASIVVLPVMLVVAIAIKLDSPGPVFFRQRRIGLGNQQFTMLKFRSMRVDLQDDQAKALTKRNDSRVTRIGNFIRKTSLDELPQFLNVLAGDMSIVGPRPHAPAALAGTLLYWEVDQKYWHRHVAKPGITGLAQVRGHRGNTEQENDLQYRLDADLEYVVEWSLLRDIEIMFATLRVLRHDRAF